MEDRQEIINCFENRLSKLPDGKKIKLSNEEILKYFFVLNKDRDYYTPPYSQCVAENFLQKIDLTNFVAEYASRISMLVGANLVGANFENRYLGFIYIKNLFLNPYRYEKKYLREIDAVNRLHSLPITNLSNVDLSNEEWDLEKFLSVLIENLKSYVKEKYQKELDEENGIWDQIDATPHILPFLDFNLHEASEKTINDVKTLAKKLIPNLQNTKLKIKFGKSYMTSIEYDIINYALKSGYFDGCYVTIHTDEIHTYDKELYYHEKEKTRKR